MLYLLEPICEYRFTNWGLTDAQYRVAIHTGTRKLDDTDTILLSSSGVSVRVKLIVDAENKLPGQLFTAVLKGNAKSGNRHPNCWRRIEGSACGVGFGS